MIKLGKEVRLQHLFSEAFTTMAHSEQLGFEVRYRCRVAFVPCRLKQDIKLSVRDHLIERCEEVKGPAYDSFMEQYILGVHLT